MIFSVQRFMEDYFARRGLTDADQYAIRVANVFGRMSSRGTQEGLLRDLSRIRTAFYRQNRQIQRREFERELAVKLRARFKKKRTDRVTDNFQDALGPTRARLRRKRRSIAVLLTEFKRAVESRAVDAFWDSRKQNVLRPRPEKIAQALLAVFAKGVLGTSGLVLREISSGIGFVDVGVTFGDVLHLIELKILKRRQIPGFNQLATYMKTEGRRKGWLVLIDSRHERDGVAIPLRMATPQGPIIVVVIEVNPTPPNVA